MIRLFKHEYRLRFLLLLLAVLILASFLPEADKTMRDSTLTSVPDVDYFMDEFRLVETDANGAPIRSLRADSMSHFPNRMVQLENPHYRLIRTQDEARQWDIRSKSGLVDNDKNEVTLTGGVVIDRLRIDPNTQSSLLTVNSQDLHIDLTKNVGRTDNPVTVANNSGTISAVGMRVYFDEQRLQLLSSVRGTYQTP